MEQQLIFWISVGTWSLLLSPLHEWAHWLTYRSFGVPASASLAITRIPKGFRELLSPTQEAIVALAGPNLHVALGVIGLILLKLGFGPAGLWTALAVTAPLARLGNYLLTGLRISFRSGKRPLQSEPQQDEDLAAQKLHLPRWVIRLIFSLLFGAIITGTWERLPGMGWTRLVSLGGVLFLYGLLTRGVLALDQKLFPKHHQDGFFK
jgi:hypothetical protein